MSAAQVPRFLYYQEERPLYILSEHPLHSTAHYIELSEKQLDQITKENLSNFIVRNGELTHKEEVANTQRRVVMITDWGVTCGIATYSKYLADALRPLVSELWILAEVAPGLSDEERVIRCWSRQSDYSRIVTEVQKINPDLIIIQHEYGLFHRHDQWNTLLSQLSRWRVLTVMHTVLEHRVDYETARRDYLSRCLTELACPEIVVHNPKAVATLRDRGYAGRIHYIPHGCFPPDREGRLPAVKYGMYPEHTIFQYGFGSRHKGWETALDVVDRLKEKYPKIFYLGMFSISDFARESQTQYYYEVLDKVKARGLENHFAIHKGFQTDQMIIQAFKCSRIALYPYRAPNSYWSSWGASGAIQIPLSLGMPLVLSNFSQFREFEGIFPLCESVDDYVAEIDKIFSDTAYEKRLSDQAYAVSESRRWGTTALRFLACKPNEDYVTPGVGII